MRRNLAILGAAIVLILIALGVYFFFFAPKTPGISVSPTQNPFGEGQDAPAGGDTTTGVESQAGDEVAPNLVRITEGPVALGTLARGISEKIITTTGSGTSTATSSTTVFDTEIRYAERESGNVFAYRFNKRTLTRISNRTLPGIQEASWSGDGALAFLRFLTTTENGSERIDTYALPTEREDGGYFLEGGLDQVIVSGTSTVVTLLPSTTGSIATIARIDGANAKTLFSSNLSSLRLFPAGKGYAAFTKASAQSDGFGFVISASGAFERVIGPLKGLTLLPSPSGKSILYSYVSRNTVSAGVIDVATRAITSLPVAALPEKCVWAPNETAVYCAIPRTMTGTWPDSWYQGTVSYSDRFWKVDLAARAAVLIVDPLAVANTPVDGVSLAIDPKADALIFTNKRDGSLWAYDL